MDKTSEKYKKYLVEINLNGKKQFLVLGMNISKDDDDFILLNEHDKILTFNNVNQIKKFILEEINLPDKDNFHNWIQEFESRKSYITYDADKIVQIIKISEGLKELSKDELSQIVDLINMIGDYAYQVNHKDLILLFEDKTIDLFKELFMDVYVWKVATDIQKSDLEKVSEIFSYADFKVAFERLFNLFNQQFSSYCS